MLTQSGLTSMEQQLVRSVMSNDLSDLKKLAATLRDQFGAVHDREKRKGKGDQKGRWGWGQRSSYMAESYMAEDENPVVTDETTENAEYDEELYDENYEEMPEGPEGTQLEEDIVAWYADQGIHAQTCSAEDLELIYDTVEHKAAAFNSRHRQLIEATQFLRATACTSPTTTRHHRRGRPKFWLRSRGRGAELVDSRDTGNETGSARREKEDSKAKARTRTRARFRARGMMANHRRALRDRHRDHQASPGLSTSR